MIVSTQETYQTRQKLWNSAQNLNFPSVMWRLPKQTDTHFLCCFQRVPERKKIDFEEFSSGFAFAPFNNPDGSDSLFLNADVHYIFKKHSEELSEELHKIHSPSSFDENFNLLINDSAENKTTSLPSKTIDPSDANKRHFLEMVNQAIQAISEGKFQKVVLSRTKKMNLSEKFNQIELFDELCQKYPAAFVSMVSIPSLDITWIGASPETLVHIDAQGIFKTMALAGTQSAFDSQGKLIRPSEAIWRQKEIEEQSFVTRYIINCLKKIRVREFEEEGPKTVIAGNLMHLRTEIIIDTKAINFPQLATIMLELLHPTSAVCGMPKEPATDFILQHENYDREFYSGFLGPVNLCPTPENKPESHIFVNLRTMKIQNKQAILYAGCGITADSNPEKEWTETEIKTQTLGKIVEKYS